MTDLDGWGNTDLLPSDFSPDIHQFFNHFLGVIFFQPVINPMNELHPTVISSLGLDGWIDPDQCDDSLTM